MISIKQYKISDIDAWNEFVRSSKNGIFMFERGFMDYHSDRFQDNSLMFYNDNELIAVLPASLHEKELRSHGGLTYGGFITNEKMKQHHMNDCIDVLKDYMQQTDLSKLIYKSIPHIYHKQPSEEDSYSLYRAGAKLFKIEPSTTVLLKNPFKMQTLRQRQVKKAIKSGVQIRTSDNFNDFILLQNQVLTSRHNVQAVHTAEELKLLRSRFGDKIQLWIAEYYSKMVAGTLLFVYENVVHTQYLAADETAREIGGLDLLIKTVMDKFSESHTYFDFGISSENNGQYLNEGLIAQKEGFGGRTTIYQTWEMIL